MDRLVMRHLYFAAFIALCSCLQFRFTHNGESLLSRTKRNNKPFWGIGPKPPDKTCLDFCAMFIMCENGGTCRLDPETCVGKCYCIPGYTGRNCRTEVDIVIRETDTTLVPKPTEVAFGSTDNKATEADVSIITEASTDLLDSIMTLNDNPSFDPLLMDHPTVTSVSESTQNHVPEAYVSTNTNIDQTTRLAEPVDLDLALKHGTTVSYSTSSTTVSKDIDRINMHTTESPTTKGNENSPHPPLPSLESDIIIDFNTDVQMESSSTVRPTVSESVHHDVNETTTRLDKDISKNNFNISNGTDTFTSNITINQTVEVEDISPVHPDQSMVQPGSTTSHNAVQSTQVTSTKLTETPVGFHSELIPQFHKIAPVQNSETETGTECFGGFPCVHGECKVIENESPVMKVKCICEPNYIGPFCKEKCDVDCGEFGHCSIIDRVNNTLGCVCAWNYTGDFCQELMPVDIVEEAKQWHWYMLGTSLVLTVALLFTIFALPYWMWRKRFVFVMKIVHYFQHYEDDDGKEFDAFVSYKSSKEDEHFVVHTLFPKLEKELNFKLCLHFRDFMPGDAIANNIVWALENSRRTIMILSPNYVDSEWCRMEYQKAQHEMLKMKHKIIPIMLEDISGAKNMDANLKCILNTVTYIQWPGEESSKKLDRFWKQLQLSLPKRKSVSSDVSDPSSSVSSSSSVGTSYSRSVSEPVPSSLLESEGQQTFPKPWKRHLNHMMDDILDFKLFASRNQTNSNENLVLSEPSTPSECSTPSSTYDRAGGLGTERTPSSVCVNTDVWATPTLHSKFYSEHESPDQIHSCVEGSEYGVQYKCSQTSTVSDDYQMFKLWTDGSQKNTAPVHIKPDKTTCTCANGVICTGNNLKPFSISHVKALECLIDSTTSSTPNTSSRVTLRDSENKMVVSKSISGVTNNSDIPFHACVTPVPRPRTKRFAKRAKVIHGLDNPVVAVQLSTDGPTSSTRKPVDSRDIVIDVLESM